MSISLSPLRYPGGKSKIYSKIRDVIVKNDLCNRLYIEPFAGGFGVGLKLLKENIVKTAILNDVDPHIYNFWHSVLYNTDDLLRLVRDTAVTDEERKNQKAIYNDKCAGILYDGFATLFLNRVNFSGVISGGPMRRLDCRFNKTDLINKIQNIAQMRGKITLYNVDAIRLIQSFNTPSFIFLDPPYVGKGERLYEYFYRTQDHAELCNAVIQYLHLQPWIITYDNCELIRGLYKQYLINEYEISYSVAGPAAAKEIVITNIPSNRFCW